MLTLLPLITLLANVVLNVLQSQGIGTPAITALITSLEGTVLPLITNLQSGTSKTSDVLAVLGALAGVITTLKAQTGLDPALLAQLGALDESVQAALAAYVQAGKDVNVATLTQIPQVV